MQKGVVALNLNQRSLQRFPVDQSGRLPTYESERRFAEVLDRLGIIWEYEPRSFTVIRASDQKEFGFQPDFYLPEYDIFLELTISGYDPITLEQRRPITRTLIIKSRKIEYVRQEDIHVVLIDGLKLRRVIAARERKADSYLLRMIKRASVQPSIERQLLAAATTAAATTATATAMAA